MKTALCIVYVVGIVVAYVILRVWDEFSDDNTQIGLTFCLAVLWPGLVPCSICAIIVVLIGKGLDRVAYAVRDAIWRVKKKWRKER